MPYPEVTIHRRLFAKRDQISAGQFFFWKKKVWMDMVNFKMFFAAADSTRRMFFEMSGASLTPLTRSSRVEGDSFGKASEHGRFRLDSGVPIRLRLGRMGALTAWATELRPHLTT